MKKFILIFLLGLSLYRCSTSDAVLLEDNLSLRYQAAVLDASVAEPIEISRNLTPINNYNQDLNRDEKGRVLVLTWTSWSGYDTLVGQETTTGVDVWVTVVPHLRDFYHRLSYSRDKKVLRLEQLLGLPPHSGKDRFVEIWVHPDNLFRPSPDPGISDSEAELAFPTLLGQEVVSPEYKVWFENLKASSYGEKGYPWTRLGYTYDWGSTRTEIGLSEFIIKKGSKVIIHSVTRNEEY